MRFLFFRSGKCIIFFRFNKVVLGGYFFAVVVVPTVGKVLVLEKSSTPSKDNCYINYETLSPTNEGSFAKSLN